MFSSNLSWMVQFSTSVDILVEVVTGLVKCPE